jgi:hypothetical protein
MYRPAPRPLMLVSPPGVAASYRRGESLSRGFSILEAEAPMPRPLTLSVPGGSDTVRAGCDRRRAITHLTSR